MTDIQSFSTKIANSTDSVLLTATITSGTDVTEALNLSGCNLVAFKLPAAFTGTAISFQGSFDGSTYYDLYRTVDNTLISTPVTADRMYLITVSDLAGVQYLKLKSDASEAADREINLLTRSMA